MDRLCQLIKNDEMLILYLPEAFEWLVLKSNALRDSYILEVLDAPAEYIESSLYFSWERFFPNCWRKRMKIHILQGGAGVGFGMKEYSVDNTDEHSVRNTLLILLGIILFLAALVIFVKEFVLVDGSMRYDLARNKWKQINIESKDVVLIAENGVIYQYKVDEEMVYDMNGVGYREDVHVNQPGEFTLYSHITWDQANSSNGLLVGYRIMTESGTVVFAWYGEDEQIEHRVKLSEGDYILQRCYIGSEEDLKKFCAESHLSYEEGKYSFPGNAEWRFDDEYGIRREVQE